MKHFDDKYFLCFPEYFEDKSWEMEVYASTSIECYGFDKGINVIFVKGETIEEIKKVAIDELATVRRLDLSRNIQLIVAKLVDKLENEKPVDPELEIIFEQGNEYCEVSEDGKSLIVNIPDPEISKPKKVFFYPSEVFSEAKKIKEL